jgi:hypothetical protein
MLLDADEPIAVKAFSLTILENVCKKEPDLARELVLIINSQFTYSTAAYKSRAKKILKSFAHLSAL